MNKNTNFTSSILVLAVVLSVGLSCSRFSNSTTAPKQYPTPNESTGTAPEPDEPITGTAPESISPKKADFTVTAEQLDKEFTKKGVKEEELKKYANKNIAVTGRVSLLSMEKKETVQPWVTLYAPGILHGVSCYFDDDNLEQMKKLKMDKNVKVQGFMDDFIVPEISPRLKHCVVLEAN